MKTGIMVSNLHKHFEHTFNLLHACLERRKPITWGKRDGNGRRQLRRGLRKPKLWRGWKCLACSTFSSRRLPESRPVQLCRDWKKLGRWFELVGCRCVRHAWRRYQSRRPPRFRKLQWPQAQREGHAQRCCHRQVPPLPPRKWYGAHEPRS